MSLPPDDLPRSPSGRVPEWVKIEAAGRQVPDTSWRTYGSTVPYPPPRRRRRRGRGIAALLVVAVGLGGVWWTQSPDPRADVETLADPATYTELRDRAVEIYDRFTAAREASAAPAPIDVALPEGLQGSGMPPPGLEEAAGRLAPVATVSGADPSYAFAALQDDGVSPVAWSPCRPVHVVVNEADAPDGFADVVAAVAAEVTAATGLVILVDGETSEEPAEERPAYQPETYGDRWAPVLVAVSDADTLPYLEGQVAGVGYTYRVGTGGIWHLVSGAVYLDEEALDLQAVDGSGEPAWVGVLRHEMGHLVGLDHVDDDSQLMNPVTSTVRTFQAGDLTGLSILGQGACAPDV